MLAASERCYRHRLIGIVAMMIATARLCTSPVMADATADIMTQCFSPEALSGQPGENHVRRPSSRLLAEGLAANTAPLPIPPPIVGEQTPEGSIRRVDLPPGAGKLIALTLDLCEQQHRVFGYDAAVFDLLRRENISATVFAGGKWMRSHPERTRQLMLDPRFELANHGDLHRNLRLLPEQAAHQEINAPQTAYGAVRDSVLTLQCVQSGAVDPAQLAPRLTLFRFPFGACSAANLRQVADSGMRAIQWSVSTGDSDRKRSATRIARDLVNGVKPGDIILAHANGRGWNSAAALAIAIPKLKAAGFEFVSVSALLAAGRPVVSQTCYSLRPGDTDRYGPLARRVPRPARRTAGQTIRRTATKATSARRGLTAQAKKVRPLQGFSPR